MKKLSFFTYIFLLFQFSLHSADGGSKKSSVCDVGVQTESGDFDVPREFYEMYGSVKTLRELAALITLQMYRIDQTSVASDQVKIAEEVLKTVLQIKKCTRKRRSGSL